MKDIRALIEDIWNEQTPDFPFFREKQEGDGKEQTPDNNDISRFSRISRHETCVLQANIQNAENDVHEKHALDRASRDIAKTPGNPGTAGNASTANDLFFPVDREKTGNPGNGPLRGAIPHDASTGPTIARHTDIFRCFICGIYDTAERPLLPVLSEERGEHHWMHSTCWPEHIRRCAQARAAALSARERIAP